MKNKYQLLERDRWAGYVSYLIDGEIEPQGLERVPFREIGSRSRGWPGELSPRGRVGKHSCLK